MEDYVCGEYLFYLLAHMRSILLSTLTCNGHFLANEMLLNLRGRLFLSNPVSPVWNLINFSYYSTFLLFAREMP